MATISKATELSIDDALLQGNVFHDVKYSYIESEDDEKVYITEYVFPLAIIISQACDVSHMSDLQEQRVGKATKYMPTILMCPIYNRTQLKKIGHLSNFTKEGLIDEFIPDPSFYSSKHKEVADNDWHYRFHELTVEIKEKTVLNDAVIDFKHYFSIPASYLLKNRSNRIYSLDITYAEQITLKFCAFLSRVGFDN